MPLSTYGTDSACKLSSGKRGMEKMIRKIKSVRGSGVLLVIVAAVLFVLFTALFFQSRLASSVTAETAVVRDGDKALLIAQSAIHEATLRLRSELADKDSQVLKLFRKAVYAPNKGEVDFAKYIDLTETKTMMAAEAGLSSFTLEKLEARIAFQKQLDRTAYERKGVICWRAAVKSPSRSWRRTRRVAEYTQRFKVTLAAPPRPCSSFGFFVADVDSMTDIEQFNMTRNKFVDELNRLKETIRIRKNSAPMHLKAGYDKLLASMAGQQQIKAAIEIPVAARAACYGLIQHGAKMALDKLDVSRDLKNYLHKLQPALSELNNAASRDPLSVYRKTDEAARKADRVIRDALWRVWAFSHVFRVLPSTENAYAELAAHFMKFAGSYWRRRAQWLVRKQNKERNINDAWERFLKKYPQPKGVIYVQNDKYPLRIEGEFKGPLVIVTGSGGAIIEDVNERDKGEHLLTVVCLGGAVKVRGTVNAALVLGREGDEEPNSLTVAKNAKLTGCLSALRLPIRCNLAGHLIRSHKFGYGNSVLDNHLHVELAPRFVYRKVYRR